jgi:hypothetical protein
MKRATAEATQATAITTPAVNTTYPAITAATTAKRQRAKSRRAALIARPHKQRKEQGPLGP